MSRSACLIFNPVAGNSPTDEQDLAAIKAFFDDFDLDVQFTTPECGAKQLAQAAVERGAEAVIVSGGDGTLSAAASALVNTDIPLGVIARGTANAFVNALGIPDAIGAACEVILAGHTRLVDTARCGEQPIVMVAGIGFEADMVSEADREMKDQMGRLAYVLAGAKQLWNVDPFEADIETDDDTIHAEVAAITIANAAPPSSILAQGPAGIVADDGLLDITYMTPQNVPDAIAATGELLKSAFQGEAAEDEHVSHLRSKRICIKAQPAQKIAIDGEVDGITTPIEVECVPKSLKIFAPAPDSPLRPEPQGNR
jgi:YegS/Rv2252/BmrU family lipid kinase